jgi:hypothetical protein
MTTAGPFSFAHPVPATAAPELPKLQRSPWFRGWAAVATVAGMIPVGLLVVAAVIL